MVGSSENLSSKHCLIDGSFFSQNFHLSLTLYMKKVKMENQFVPASSAPNLYRKQSVLTMTVSDHPSVDDCYRTFIQVGQILLL